MVAKRCKELDVLTLDEELAKFCPDRDFVFHGTLCQKIRELHRHVFSIVGPQGVGKTTIVHKLCKMIPCASALNEVVRDVPFCNEINDGQTIRTTKWIYYEHIRRLLEILFANSDAESHIVICDRSEYDCLLYYINGKCDFEKSVESLKKITQDEKTVKPYHHHIILFDDDMFDGEIDDDFRLTDKRYFIKKRILFYKFFTTAFDDVLIIDRNTPINDIICWIQGQSQQALVE